MRFIFHHNLLCGPYISFITVAVHNPINQKSSTTDIMPSSELFNLPLYIARDFIVHGLTLSSTLATTPWGHPPIYLYVYMSLTILGYSYLSIYLSVCLSFYLNLLYYVPNLFEHPLLYVVSYMSFPFDKCILLINPTNVWKINLMWSYTN